MCVPAATPLCPDAVWDMTPPVHRHGTQLRLGFDSSLPPTTMNMVLAGLRILADTDDGTDDAAARALRSVGVTVFPHPAGGFSFSALDLRTAATMPAEVTVVADGALAPLWRLARHLPPTDEPATLSYEAGGFRLLWFDANGDRFDEWMDPEASTALLASDLPFVATSQAWAHLGQFSSLPVAAGQGRLNPDGFIEITTAKPQLVEASPLPGLFRVADCRFGLSAPHALAFDSSPGFSWQQRPPHALLAEPPETLGDRLDRWSAAAVVVPDVVTAARAVAPTLVALGVWPLLVVTPPAALWTWRHVLASYTDGEDLEIVTYSQLSAGHIPSAPAAIIIDAVSASVPSEGEARAAINRLSPFRDATRVALVPQMPSDPNQARLLGAVLRPAEFDLDRPIQLVYPRGEEGLADHLGSFRFDPQVRSLSGLPAVVVSTLGVEQREAVEEALVELRDGRPPPEVLASVVEVTSVGTDTVPSAKLAEALELVRTAVAAGRRVALVSRHGRAALMARVLLRPFAVQVVDETAPPADLSQLTATQVTVIRYDRHLPPLAGFDSVVVLDWPWSFSALDVALRTPKRPHVTMVHVPGSVDDVLASFAESRPSPIPPTSTEAWQILRALPAH